MLDCVSLPLEVALQQSFTVAIVVCFLLVRDSNVTRSTFSQSSHLPFCLVEKLRIGYPHGFFVISCTIQTFYPLLHHFDIPSVF